MQRMSGKSETDWLKSLKDGNELAFTRIYNTYWEKLYIVAYRKLLNRSASEEIVQEVFLQLWKKRKELDIQNLSAYLAAMTRYAVYRHLTRENKLKKEEELYFDERVKPIVHSDFDNRFLLEMINQLSCELPEKCRLVFTYNKLQDRSLKEVARDLNISPKTAEAHLTKALRFVRLRMSKIMGLVIAFLYSGGL